MTHSTDHKTLALVVHFHQPVGNLDSVVRNATDRCYRPFLEVLDGYRDIPMTLHYSGCLLEWLESNAPDVTRMLRDMSERGQIELMTGGFYEPVLAALPPRDQVGQIELLTKHLRDEYLAGGDGGPTGLWLTERVWEQDVITSLVDAGVRYTVLDDTMFHSVGVTDEELDGAFVTEHDGRPLYVYAGDRQLRYLIPYKRVSRIIDHLRSGREGRLFVYADDGEKFGEWPDTYERVYDNKWLASFFDDLLEQKEWLSLTTLGAHCATAEPKGRVYL
ncbi:MAG: alpha-amylase, partial [Actinomycetota bacterium]|nr:alpha-amylase [Actinomycetota bacterium]